mmetsp:Transcript_9169/g.15713  ORF Transcript_9169/g.15713 Transcript_9169/m.15713 type:complete len:82 (+) Transcript_9169:155-400(+)
MPTSNRVGYIRKRARLDFEASRKETDPEKIEFLLRLAATQLDNILIQAQHLTEISKLDLTPIKGIKNSVSLDYEEDERHHS